ncbi:MAG: hypothetical protein RR614_11825, partial [Eubacterium sp.]
MPLSVIGYMITIYVCTIVGITTIPFVDANRILLHEILHLPVNMDGIAQGNVAIIWNVRLPRVFLSSSIITGGLLTEYLETIEKSKGIYPIEDYDELLEVLRNDDFMIGEM